MGEVIRFPGMDEREQQSAIQALENGGVSHEAAEWIIADVMPRLKEIYFEIDIEASDQQMATIRKAAHLMLVRVYGEIFALEGELYKALKR